MVRAALPIVIRKDATDEILSEVVLQDDRPEVFLGRDEHCAVVLDDETVSRFHAQLQMLSGEVRIRDLGSSNGTFVNNVRVRGGGTVLGDGARIDVGKYTIRVFFIGASHASARSDASVGERYTSARIARFAESSAEVYVGPRRSSAAPATDQSQRKTAPIAAVPIDDRSESEPDQSVGTLTPGDEPSPPEKVREATVYTPAEVRDAIRNAMAGMPLDRVALRAFHHAYRFRRSVRTTDEGDTALDERHALAAALARAFTRELDDTDEPLPTSSAVPTSFLEDAVAALDLVADYELRGFSETVEERSNDVSFAESVSDALVAYARHARNGLTSDPW